MSYVVVVSVLCFLVPVVGIFATGDESGTESGVNANPYFEQVYDLLQDNRDCKGIVFHKELTFASVDSSHLSCVLALGRLMVEFTEIGFLEPRPYADRAIFTFVTFRYPHERGDYGSCTTLKTITKSDTVRWHTGCGSADLTNMEKNIQRNEQAQRVRCVTIRDNCARSVDVSRAVSVSVWYRLTDESGRLPVRDLSVQFAGDGALSEVRLVFARGAGLRFSLSVERR